MNNDANLDELFQRYFGKARSEFENRTIYKELSPEIIRSIPDDALLQAIHDFIRLKADPDGGDFDEGAAKLGAAFSAVHFVGLLDAEVLNGGFYQFFYNCGRDAVVRARQGADLMGLTALSSIVSDALSIEEAEREKIQRIKAEGTLEAFFESYEDISFEIADKAFEALNLDLHEERVRFIREHSEMFRGRVGN